MKHHHWPGVCTLILGSLLIAGPSWAQKSYDDHDLRDRFYIRLGGFAQEEIRTTVRIDAKTPEGGIRAGALIGLESLFNINDQVTTGRLDGWYRFGKKHRINWNYWESIREGVNTYPLTDANGNPNDPIEIGDVVIRPGDTIRSDSDTIFVAVVWTYSFLNTSKYEAWLGAGLNTQRIDYKFQTTIEFSPDPDPNEEQAKGTIPLPVFSFGGRWNFSPRWRSLVFLDVFGIEIGDYSGRLNNSRFLVEFDITKNFGIGAGIERYSFEVNAESEDYLGELDISYSGATIFLKGQF